MHKFVITEEQLLNENHYPVIMVFNSASEEDFPYVMECLSNAVCYENNGGGFIFWDDLDEYEQHNTKKFEGICFEPSWGESIIISYADVLYYIEISCKNYLLRFPDKNELLKSLITSYKYKFT